MYLNGYQMPDPNIQQEGGNLMILSLARDLERENLVAYTVCERKKVGLYVLWR